MIRVEVHKERERLSNQVELNCIGSFGKKSSGPIGVLTFKWNSTTYEQEKLYNFLKNN